MLAILLGSITFLLSTTIPTTCVGAIGGDAVVVARRSEAIVHLVSLQNLRREWSSGSSNNPSTQQSATVQFLRHLRTRGEELAGLAAGAYLALDSLESRVVKQELPQLPWPEIVIHIEEKITQQWQSSTPEGGNPTTTTAKVIFEKPVQEASAANALPKLIFCELIDSKCQILAESPAFSNATANSNTPLHPRLIMLHGHDQEDSKKVEDDAMFNKRGNILLFAMANTTGREVKKEDQTNAIGEDQIRHYSWQRARRLFAAVDTAELTVDEATGLFTCHLKIPELSFTAPAATTRSWADLCRSLPRDGGEEEGKKLNHSESLTNPRGSFVQAKSRFDADNNGGGNRNARQTTTAESPQAAAEIEEGMKPNNAAHNTKTNNDGYPDTGITLSKAWVLFDAYTNYYRKEQEVIDAQTRLMKTTLLRCFPRSSGSGGGVAELEAQRDAAKESVLELLQVEQQSEWNTKKEELEKFRLLIATAKGASALAPRIHLYADEFSRKDGKDGGANDKTWIDGSDISPLISLCKLTPGKIPGHKVCRVVAQTTAEGPIVFPFSLFKGEKPSAGGMQGWRGDLLISIPATEEEMGKSTGVAADLSTKTIPQRSWASVVDKDPSVALALSGQVSYLTYSPAHRALILQVERPKLTFHTPPPVNGDGGAKVKSWQELKDYLLHSRSE